MPARKKALCPVNPSCIGQLFFPQLIAMQLLLTLLLHCRHVVLPLRLPLRPSRPPLVTLVAHLATSAPTPSEPGIAEWTLEIATSNGCWTTATSLKTLQRITHGKRSSTAGACHRSSSRRWRPLGRRARARALRGCTAPLVRPWRNVHAQELKTASCLGKICEPPGACDKKNALHDEASNHPHSCSNRLCNVQFCGSFGW